MADGNINIVGTLDLKNIEKSVDSLENKIRDAAVNMGVSIEGLTDKIKTDFDKMNKVIQSAGKSKLKIDVDAEGVDEIKDTYDSVIKEIKDLQKAMTSGGMDIDEYSSAYETLNRRLKDVAEQGLIAGKNLPKVTALNVDQVRSIQSGTVSETDISGYNRQELLQAEQIMKNIVASEVRSDDELRDIADKRELINQRLKEQLKTTKQIETEEKKAAASGISSPLVGYSDTDSLVEMTAKTKAYKKALSELEKPTTDNKDKASQYRKEIVRLETQMNRVTGAADRNRSAMSRLNDGFKNLMTRMAFYVGTGAVISFVKQIVSVTAEFEKTTVALGAIIKDFDKANQLFLDIQESALKSPFTIMELTQSTKQLAAYNVGVEDLHSTMTMLADLSAGVGVDMQRLVVNYGQIKALGVANNRELKDFAVAGLPVYEELATRFTVLEGRMVSAGEVFERVSNRMVSFQDVQAVLENLTAEGGRFYNIQEEMSKTMAGRISNLADAYQLMFNELGNRGEGFILAIIKALQYLAKNWEDFIPLVKALGVALTGLGVAKVVSGFNKIVSVFSAFGGAIKTAIGQMKGFSAASLKAAGANPWIAFATVITMVATYFISLSREAGRFKRELDEIYNRHVNTFEEIAESVEDLAYQLKEANEGSQEHKDLLVDISSKYGKYLDFVLSEETALDAVYKAREKVIDGLKREQMVKAQSEAASKIEEKYSDDLSDYRSDLAKALTSGIVGVTEQDAKAIIANWEKALSAGLDTTITDVAKEYMDFDEIEYVNTGASKASANMTKINQSQIKLKTSLKEYNNELDNSNKIIQEKFNYEQISTRAEADARRKSDLYYENLERTLSRIKEKEGAYYDILQKEIDAMVASEALTKDQAKFIKENNDLRSFGYNEAIALSEKLEDISNFKLDVDFGTGTEVNLRKYADNLLKWGDGMVNDINKKLSEMGLGEDVLGRVTINEDEAKEGFGKIIEQTKSAYENSIDYIETIEQVRDENKKLGKSTNEIGELEEERLVSAKKNAEGYLALLKLLGVEMDKGGGGRGGQTDTYSKQLSILNDMVKKYRELSGLNGDLTKSAEETKEAYQGIFDEAFKDTGLSIDDLISFDNTQIAKFLRDFQSKFAEGSQGSLAVGEVAADYEMKARISVSEADLQKTQSEIDKLFQDYEIGVEIDAMGDYGNILRGIFDVDKISLTDLETELNKILDGANLKSSELSRELAGLKVKAAESPNDAGLQSEVAEMEDAYNNQIQLAENTEKKLGEIRKKALIDEITQRKEYIKQYGTYEQKKLELARYYENRIADSRGVEKQQLEYQYKGELSALNSEAFARSIDWSAALSGAGYLLGDILEETLSKSREYLDTDEFKAASIEDKKTIMEAIHQMEDSLGNGKALDFKGLGKSMESYKDIVEQLEKAKNDEKNALEKTSEALQEYEKALKNGNEAQIEAASQTLQETTKTSDSISNTVKELEEGSIEAQNVVIATATSIKNNMDKALSGLSSIFSGNSLSGIWEGLIDIGEAFGKSSDGIKNAASEMADSMKSVPIVGWILSIIDLIKEGLVPIIDNISDLVVGIIETAVQETLSGDIFESVHNLIADVIEAIVTAIYESVAAPFSGDFWANMLDKLTFNLFDVYRSNTEILEDIEEVRKGQEELEVANERIKNSYRELERAAEKAMGAGEIGAKRAMAANLELQRSNAKLRQQEIEEQIALEKSLDYKEGSDKDIQRDKRVDALKAEYEDLDQEMKEIGWSIKDTVDSITNDLLGSDLKSASEDFASSFLDAWKSGDDPFAAIEGGFTDMLDNMIVKAMAGEIVARRLKDIFTMVDVAAESGDEITPEEYKEIAAAGEGLTQGIGEDLTKLMEALDIGFGSGADASLSNLQKGIQGVSETTAGALEALYTTQVTKTFELVNIATSQLAVGNAQLNEIRAGNATRNAILSLLQGSLNDDGRSIRVNLE